jgi:hypothetical protein
MCVGTRAEGGLYIERHNKHPSAAPRELTRAAAALPRSSSTREERHRGRRRRRCKRLRARHNATATEVCTHEEAPSFVPARASAGAAHGCEGAAHLPRQVLHNGAPPPSRERSAGRSRAAGLLAAARRCAPPRAMLCRFAASLPRKGRGPADLPAQLRLRARPEGGEPEGGWRVRVVSLLLLLTQPRRWSADERGCQQQLRRAASSSAGSSQTASRSVITPTRSMPRCSPSSGRRSTRLLSQRRPPVAA